MRGGHRSVLGWDEWRRVHLSVLWDGASRLGVLFSPRIGRVLREHHLVLGWDDWRGASLVLGWSEWSGVHPFVLGWGK